MSVASVLPPIRTLHRERSSQQEDTPFRRRSMSSFYTFKEIHENPTVNIPPTFTPPQSLSPRPSLKERSKSFISPLTPTSLEEFRRVLRKKHYLDTLSSLEIRDLVDAADTKIFSIDDSCLVRLWNKKMAEFTRVSEDDCVGQPLHEVLGGLHYPDTFYHKVYAALHGEETLGFECPVYDAKGDEYICLLNVAARRDAASIILGATIVLQYSFSQRSNILADVDAQYHFDALAALHGALQKDAQREAAALAQAEAVLQTKVTYVRRLSHEVRTPLQVIYSGLQLILSRKRAEVSHGVLGVLEEMRQSCLDGMGILDDLLSYERLDAGTMTLEREALPVTELVRQSMRDFSVHAELSDVRLEYSDPFGENRRNRPLVNADRRKMTQVLRNMLSNALRFSPAGSCIRVRVLCVTRRKELLARIEVADSGPGLTPEMRERLVKDAGRFDHTELLESEQGHGMGLWLLRGIVEMHSGQVGVESEGAGKGSTFFVELPVLASPTSQPFSGSVDSSDQNTLFRSYPITPHPRRAGLEQPLRFSFSSSASSENSAEEEELAASRPLRILIVDDSVLCRKMVSRLLKEEGCLDEAADGVEALRSVLRSMQDEAPYHIVVMDSAMPNMIGPAATEELRRQGFKGVILGLTGNALPADVDSFIARGADAVLLKPLDVDVLKRYISDTRRRVYKY